MKKLILATLMLGIFVFGSTTIAQAVPLLPGQSIAASLEAMTLNKTLLASLSTPWSHNLVSGTLDQWVYRDNSDGNLIFAYKVYNDSNSLGDLHRLVATNFSGFSTYVAYESASIAPLFFDRDSFGSTIGFQYGTDPGTYVSPGESSVILWIKTNAKYYQPGEVSIINGGAVNIFGYAPAVPEPTSMLLFGSGLLGLLGLKRKK